MGNSLGGQHSDTLHQTGGLFVGLWTAAGQLHTAIFRISKRLCGGESGAMERYLRCNVILLADQAVMRTDLVDQTKQADV